MLRVMSAFERSIKEWVTLDNQLKKIQDTARELREKRSELSDTIHKYTTNNNLSNATIEISDGRLKFGHTQTTQSLTFKFLEECLNEIISNKEQVQKIITHIKNKRETKVMPDIKRYYSDN
jgi:hypothetical protein